MTLRHLRIDFILLDFNECFLNAFIFNKNFIIDFALIYKIICYKNTHETFIMYC